MNNVLILFLFILIIISLIFLKDNNNNNNNLIEDYESELKNEPILKYNLEYINIPLIQIYKNNLDYSNQLNDIKKSYSNIIIVPNFEYKSSTFLKISSSIFKPSIFELTYCEICFLSKIAD